MELQLFEIEIVGWLLSIEEYHIRNVETSSNFGLIWMLVA